VVHSVAGIPPNVLGLSLRLLGQGDMKILKLVSYKEYIGRQIILLSFNTAKTLIAVSSKGDDDDGTVGGVFKLSICSVVYILHFSRICKRSLLMLSD